MRYYTLRHEEEDLYNFITRFGFVKYESKTDINDSEDSYLYTIYNPFQKYKCSLISLRKDATDKLGCHSFPYLIFSNTDFDSKGKDLQFDLFYDMMNERWITKVDEQPYKKGELQ